jgi:hypothetical protein
MKNALRVGLVSALLVSLFTATFAIGATFKDLGGVKFATGVILGDSGTLLEDSYVATLTTNFVGVAANDCKVSAAITLTGAAAGDICVVGVPTSDTTDLSYTCVVTATDAAKIKICNPTAAVVGSGTNPSTGVYTVRSLD